MSLLKNTSIYFFSNSINAIVPFLLLPILTRNLTTAEYGQIAIFQSLLIVLGSFIGVNSLAVSERKYYDMDISHSIIKQFNGSCVQIICVTACGIFCIFYIWGSKLSQLLNIPIEWIFLSVAVCSFSTLISMRLGQWQIRNKAKKYALLQLSYSFLNLFLSLLFVVWLVKGGQGRVNAQVIASIVMALVALCLLYRDELLDIFVWRPKYIKEIIQIGVPLIPHPLGIFLICTVDRIIISDKLGLSAAGIYMVAVQLSSAMTLIFDALNKAYVPWLFERLKRNDIHEKKQIVTYTYGYFIVVLFLALMGFIFGPIVITLVAGSDYQLAGTVIGWLCLGQAFGGMYLMVTNYVFFAKKTGQLALVTIITGGINLILLFTLINYYGVLGAAIAFVISKLIQFLLTWVLAMKHVNMPWGIR